MQYIALVILCIALIFVSYYSPKIGFGLLGALAVILTALYFLNLDDSESTRFPVPRDSIELGNVRATKSYGDSWDYTGRISNSSSKNVTDVQVKILLYDCPADSESISEDCVVIGDQIDYVPINIPARQARDFQDNISFRNASPQGKLFWDFELVGLRISD